MEKLSLNALLKKRSSIKGQMTRIVTFVDTEDPDKPKTVEALKTRIERSQKLLEEFTAVEDAIFNLSETAQSDLEEFEENYYHALTELNTVMRQKSLVADNVTVGGNDTLNTSGIQPVSDLKLPRMNIPCFDGDYKDWQSFYDLFTKTIHENVSLSPAQKFQYLKGCLKGEASNLLKHISITEANYYEAFQRLCKRFNKKKHIVNSFIQTFVDQPNIRNSHPSSLRKLTDTCDEVIRGLKALGHLYEARDPWLIYLMVNKLDNENQQMWANFIIEIECPTWSDFTTFLNQRADAAEGFKVPYSSKPVKKINSNLRSMHLSSENACSICQGEHHHLSECSKFLDMQVADRRKHIKNILCCYNCLSKGHPVFKCHAKGKCNKCSKRHHPLLHLEESDVPSSSTTKQNHSKSIDSYHINANANTTPKTNFPLITHTLLPTASVLVMNSSGELQQCRALLDSGSQMSFITESCAQRLQLNRSNARVAVSGLSSSKAAISHGITEIVVASRLNHNNTLKFKALILSRITSNLPSVEIRRIDLKNVKNLELADPEYNKPGPIDLLIGADQFFKILNNASISSGPNNPIAQDTIFGWVIAGEFKIQDGQEHSIVNLHTEIDIDRSLRKFWELEEIKEESNFTNEEKMCENHFVENYYLQPDGRYIVRLPIKESDIELGNSHLSAIARLRSLERRFYRDSTFQKEYTTFMREYESLHHMELIPKNEIEVSSKNSFYLPHHGVIKSSSSTTKLRVVFDASASSQSGLSLNDKLMVGPTIQSSLLSILLRFRMHKIAFSADIEKMYRQILIDKKDVDYQRIVWREDPTMEIKHYRLTTVTYGTSCAPFLATRVLKQIASDIEKTLPTISRIIDADFYIDDLLSGAETETEALDIQVNITRVLAKAGFNLRKWLSNNQTILNMVSDDNKINDNFVFSEDSTVKVLGLQWNPNTDCFSFQINLNANPTLTKRGILSESSRIFDPLGWLSPSIILIKIFFQQLWLLKLGWDEGLPENVISRWTNLRNEIPLLQHLKIPRWLGHRDVTEFHGFSDASEMAYAAVIYARTELTDGTVIVKLITSKTKVSPIKQISIPRLELCGAGLLSKLLDSTIVEMKLEKIQVYAWTDSTIVLSWLSQSPRQWKTFVANRVSQIHSAKSSAKWLHVRSKDNPADCASRGISPSELIHNSLWWNGPSWLTENKSNWPIKTTDNEILNNEEDNAISIERKTDSALVFKLLISEQLSNIYERLITKISSFSKLISVISWSKRFIHNCRCCILNMPKKEGGLTTIEQETSLNSLIHWVQEDNFRDEFNHLQNKSDLPSYSRIKSLSPFLDENGIIRVGGRIENSLAPFEVKHPIILPPSHKFTKRLVTEEHQKNLHAGTSLLMNILKQKYWIIRGKDIIRKTIRECVICVRHQQKTETQMMSDLPKARVTYERPFMKIGIDYAGPISIRMQKGRGRPVHKAYIAFFVCCSTKAVHIELVNDLTTESFFGALQRFTARRGLCTEIFSDNGSNFIGAERKLTDLFHFLKKNYNLISEFLLKDKINWNFNPSAAPHMGGLWEAAVKSTKYHLKRIIGVNILTYEEMSTLLTKIEAILNTRPIVPTSSDDIDVLTPAHFLIGHQNMYLPEQNLQHLKENNLSRWQLVQQIAQHFWKRWHEEYLTTLQKRNKWLFKENNIKQNDIVIIKEENLPASKWLLGRIVVTHPGKDGLVRVVTIQTKSGIIKRPIHKVIRIPMFETDVSRSAE